MKILEASKLLDKMGEQNVFLFGMHDLSAIFQESGETLKSTLKRLLSNHVLEKIGNGVYANPKLIKCDPYRLERIAAYFRPDSVNYLSAESVLCNLSIISQQMLDRITVMTTGRSGEFKTPYGTIEFTHTKRDPFELLDETTQPEGFPIRMADKHIALRDLKKIGRNLNMIDWEAFNDED